VLSEVKGTNAGYTLRGDEVYVRAKIVSSKPKVNGSVADEFETAWTQPLVNESKSPSTALASPEASAHNAGE
jgi:hypothetical protein